MPAPDEPISCICAGQCVCVADRVGSLCSDAAGQIAFVSGGCAAIGSSVVKVPIAVCIRSVQAGVYSNVFQAARSIKSAAGVQGLFTVSFTRMLLFLSFMNFEVYLLGTSMP